MLRPVLGLTDSAGRLNGLLIPVALFVESFQDFEGETVDKCIGHLRPDVDGSNATFYSVVQRE